VRSIFDDKSKPARRTSAPLGARQSFRLPDRSGRPLEAGSRRFFEARFGVDFGAVRIHDDAETTATARALDARAFTVGNRIGVDAAELSGPGASRLLAHELAHVVQQTARGPASPVTTAALESDAAQAARAVIGGPGRAAVRLSAPVAVAFDRRSSASASHTASGTITSRSDTESRLQSEVTRLRPSIPAGVNIFGMMTFDSSFYAHASDWFDFRGHVMRGGDVNYYFIAMAMAHQGYSWDGAQDMIWLWNTSQHLLPGDPTMTAEMWFAAREGFNDELRRMPPRPVRPPHQPFSSPPFTCFPGDVPVAMADGSARPIGAVRPGDRVLAADERAGALRACEVTAAHLHPAGGFLVLRLAGGRALRVTANHPLWTGAGWAAAGSLQPGDEVFALTDGKGDLARLAVVAVEPSASPASALHDLTVADCHTFFACGILVHNKLP
jgi:hypothetical protein